MIMKEKVGNIPAVLNGYENPLVLATLVNLNVLYAGGALEEAVLECQMEQMPQRKCLASVAEEA